MKKLIMGSMMVILFSACSIKDYRMFDNGDTENLNQSQEINISYESRIMPDDVLAIDIYNMNQKSNILRDSSLLNSVNNEPKNRYVVESDGTIYLPLLQEFKVQGLTTKELSVKLTNAYSRYLKQPYVKAMVKNHKVYVLGEVNKQGIVPIEGNRISVIEALSRAGGMTDHALLDRIRIISQVGGKYRLSTLNLQQFETLNLKNMVLQPNSIVYVEPKTSKAFKVGVQDYLPVIQAISSVASTFLAIKYVSN
jgi:polysaccharide export outer membrane protein